MIQPPKCDFCKDTGWITFKREAPSPPYKEGTLIDYGINCNKCEKGQ